jgi:hypothetical protein
MPYAHTETGYSDSIKKKRCEKKFTGKTKD